MGLLANSIGSGTPLCTR